MKMVCSFDSDIDFFDIVAGLLIGDTLALYLFIICLDYVLETSIDLMKENSLILKMARSRRYPTESITDENYGNDLVLLVNTPVQAKSVIQPGAGSKRHWLLHVLR